MSADYILVGAGTAGCVLADRLTARGHHVLVLEAGGGDRHLHVQTPAAFAKLFKSKRDWAYHTSPQAALNQRAVFWPRGKMLGGSSSMNAQIHQWCCASDFDDWQSAGATGWGWETMRAALSRIDADVDAGRLRDPNPLTRAFLDAAANIGLPTVDTHCGGVLKVGAAIATVAHRNGARRSAADAFLRPALKAGARLLKNAEVSRLLFTDGRASGVALTDGRIERAARGVILTAGAVNTPLLLMRSGLGDASALRAAGIDVIADSPEIGANLQDHLMYVTHFRVRRPITLKSAESLAQLWRYLTARRGMLASNVAEAMAFFGDDAHGVDLELVFAPALFENEGLTPPSAHGFSIGVVLLKPQSRGRISLDANGAARIDPNYLAEPDDLERLLHGVSVAKRAANASALAREHNGEINPGSDDETAITAAIRAQAHTLYHPVGTCRMGADERAPVRPDLSVRGVEALWAADASVMPAIPRGHPNAVVAAIADHAAALIAG